MLVAKTTAAVHEVPAWTADQLALITPFLDGR